MTTSVSTFAPGLIQRSVTEISAAANTDREPYVCPVLLEAGVPQIPEDVFRLWAIWGDDDGDQRLGREQRVRMRLHVRHARNRLRELRREEQRQKKTWENRDTGLRGPFSGQEVWLDEEPDPNEPVQIFGPVYHRQMDRSAPRRRTA